MKEPASALTTTSKNTEELATIFHTKYDQLKQNCDLMTGAIEALNFCQKHNMDCIVLSNYNQKPLEMDIERFEITKYFKAILGNKDLQAITSYTNKYERLHHYMEQHAYSPDKTFIIGDSHEEPELARKLNILGISMGGGLLSPARLEKHKKDHLIHCLHELPSILTQEWGLNKPETRLA